MMEVPQIVTQMEPVSECAQLMSAWVDAHYWSWVLFVALAVFGGLVLISYAVLLVGGLVERAYESYKQKRGKA